MLLNASGDMLLAAVSVHELHMLLAAVSVHELHMLSVVARQ